MTTDRDFDRIAMTWLADGPDELSDRVLDAVVDQIHLTRQRPAKRVPWRFPTMNTPARVAAAAVVGVLVVGGAVFLFARPGQPSIGGAGPAPSPSASIAPSTTSSASASASSGAIVPAAMTASFTSDHNGFAIKYPAGWTVVAATQSWRGDGPDQDGVYMDKLRSPDARLAVTSAPLGAQTPDEWKAAYAARFGLDGNGVCDAAPADWPSIQIGGQPGLLIGNDCPAGDDFVPNGHFFEAIAFVGDRVYLFWIEGSVDRTPIQAFDAFLDTVVFDPASAVD